jgi:hypothetical protein
MLRLAYLSPAILEQLLGAVKILKFDDSVLKAFLAISKDVVAQAGSGDELSR